MQFIKYISHFAVIVGSAVMAFKADASDVSVLPFLVFLVAIIIPLIAQYHK